MMKIRFLFATAAVSAIMLAACGQSTMMDDHNDAAMSEQTAMSTEGESMADSDAMTETMTDTMMADSDAMMTDTMMIDSHAMTDTMMSDSHAMTDTADMAMDDSHAMTDTMMSDTTDMAMDDADAMMHDLPAWQTMTLTDARTGETFSLADFAGKTVFVETMATWCTNCRQQLGNVKSAVARADMEQVVFIGISVETNLAAETLAQYANDNGFVWTFAVATPEMLQALADAFGQTIANPPATPHFIIQPDGSHSELTTGFESGDQILANLGL
ncbi:MAG: TlpA disulfide reductase family protein [Caldilineaceae bacterium]